MSAHLPAFPVPLNNGEAYKTHAPCDGLTKRELIAAMAMQGYLSRPPAMTNESEQEYDAKIARWSTDTADALLAELAKEPEA